MLLLVGDVPSNTTVSCCCLIRGNLHINTANRVWNDIKSEGRGVILKCKSFDMIATKLHRCLAENISSFIIKLGQNDVENKNKACVCDETEVHVWVRISFTAGKDWVGRFPSPQDHGVETLMLHRSYWKRTGGQKRQRELRMKEEEIEARMTLVCYSWSVYKIWGADV